MDLRSTPMTEMTSGPVVRWLNGRWCYAWSDGTIIPAMYGFDNDDADDDDDTDDTEDEDDDDDDDEEGDDTGGSAKSKSSKSAQRASRQAAKYRNERNTLRTERDDLKRQLEEANTKLKDGTGDETAKARITELETENAQLKEQLGEVSSTIAKQNMSKQVGDLKDTLDISDNEDFVLWLIENKSDLEADDDGEFDERELKTFLKRQVKKGTLSVASGDDDDEDDEDDDESASGARTASSRRFNGKKKQRKDGLDRASLEAKFPALRR